MLAGVSVIKDGKSGKQANATAAAIASGRFSEC